MLCRHPYVVDRSGDPFFETSIKERLRGVPFRCGKCLACRVAIRREWTTRLLLEMLTHDMGCFVTLTYAEEYCPVTETGYRTLSLVDLQKFMKRFRVNLERAKGRKYPIRFFAVGEYGARFTQRPHYHIIIFGASNYDRDVIKAINDAWSVPAAPGKRQGESSMYGNVTIDSLNAKTVAYTAGYIAKKFINPIKKHKVITSTVEVGSKRVSFEKVVLDRKRSNRDENGVLAEFRTMSRMPGLGSGILPRFLALAKSSEAFRRCLFNDSDVPSVVRAFGRVLFLDRYLKTKLRELLGIEPDPTRFLDDLREQFFAWTASPSPHRDFYHYLVAQDDQRYKQLVDRVKRQISKARKF